MRVKLTEKAINRKPPASGIMELWDSTLPGFGLRIYPARNGAARRVYFAMTRVNGRQIRRRLGMVGGISLADARKAARKVFEDAGRGIDPKERDRAARREAERARRNTFRAVAEDFLTDHGRWLGAATLAEYRRKLDQDVLPQWGARPIAEIERADVKALIRAKAVEAPVAANRLLVVARKIFNWAIDEDIITASPAVRIKPEPEAARERVLTDAELRDVWRGAERMGYPFGHLVRFLVVTCQRRTEAAGLRWSEIDGADWRLPAERTKTGSGHLVPLSPLALDILADCEPDKDEDAAENGEGSEDEREHVFTSGARGDLPISGWSKFKRRLDTAILDARRDDAEAADADPAKAEPLAPWTLHDLRRTGATGMRALGIDRLTVSKVLNHAEAGITKVYDRYAADPEKRHALDAWTAHVAAVVSGDEAPSNVVVINRAR